MVADVLARAKIVGLFVAQDSLFFISFLMFLMTISMMIVIIIIIMLMIYSTQTFPRVFSTLAEF